VRSVRASLEKLLGPAGVLPETRPLACPSTEEELLETIRLAAFEGWRIVPIGLGSKLAPEAQDREATFLLSTRRIAGIVAYEPGDGTLTASAGTTMAELERTARTGGNHLTPCVPAPVHSTLGGVLAAGQSGLDRLRYGPSRHHVLGMRVALADASVARSGGRLVKNVTGYDLHRLYCGSRGSLCVILEASLRLCAGFARERLLSATARDRAGAIALALAAADLGLQPLSIRAENVLDPRGVWRVHVLLAGREEVVDWSRDVVLGRLPGFTEGLESIDRLRDAEIAPGRRPDLTASGRPSKLPETLARLPEDLRMIVEPAIAIAWVFVEGDRLPSVAGELRRASGTRPGEALAERLKQVFDPRGILPARR